MIEAPWRLVVRLIGGVHAIGHLWIIVHDSGFSVAWKQVEKLDWRIK